MVVSSLSKWLPWREYLFPFLYSPCVLNVCFIFSVAMITLLGDGLQALYPLDHVTSRLLCFCLMIPFEFLPLRKLSAASLIGIISCASLVIIVLYDGFAKIEQPGSLWDPMVSSRKKPCSFPVLLSPGMFVIDCINIGLRNSQQRCCLQIGTMCHSALD